MTLNFTLPLTDISSEKKNLLTLIYGGKNGTILPPRNITCSLYFFTMGEFRITTFYFEKKNQWKPIKWLKTYITTTDIDISVGYEY